MSCACEGLGLGRSTYYARLRPRTPHNATQRPTPKRELSSAEQERAIAIATSEEYDDKAPATLVASLLDKEEYICSERTLYRILKAQKMVHECRSAASHQAYSKPELMATQRREVRTWDITKLKGPQKRVVYSLYVVLDIYSRFIVGWLLATCEDDELARTLIETTFKREGVERGQLTIHADIGGVMRSNTLYDLIDKLEIRKVTQSRAAQTTSHTAKASSKR